MEIEIHKHETDDQVVLNLLLTWAKDYTDSFNTPVIDDTDIKPTDTEETKTNEFIHSLLLLNGVLVVYDETKQCDVNSFIQEFLDHISGCVVPELTYVLDSQEYSVFSSNERYIFQRITSITDGFEFLEHIRDDFDPNVDHYIFINNFFLYCFEDYIRFMKILDILLSLGKLHIILITNEYELLNEDIIKQMQYRIGFWIGSTKVSKALFGTNVLCSPVEEHQVVYSCDYGESFDIKTYKDTDDTLKDIDNLLDV